MAPTGLERTQDMRNGNRGARRCRRSDSRPYAQHAPTGGTGALKRRPTQRRGAPVSATKAAAVHQLKLCFVVVLSVIPRTVAPRPRAAYNLALQFHARCLWVLRHAHYSERARAQHAEHHAARSHPLLCGPPNRSADGTCTHVRQRRSDSRPYAQHAPTGGTGALKRRPTQRRGAPVSATNAAAVHQLKLCFVVVLSVIPRTVAPRPRAAYNLALQFHARCLWVLRHAHYSERARAQHAEHHAARSHPLLCGPPNRSADGTCTHVRQRRSDSRPYAQHAPTGGTGALKARAQHAEHHAARSHPLLCGPPNRSADGTCTHVRQRRSDSRPYAQHAPTGGTGALKRRPTQRRGAPVSATKAAAVHQLKLCFVVVLSVIPRTVAPRPRAAYNLALQFHARCLWVLRHAHYSERARAQHAEHHAARSHPLLCGPPNRSADGTCTHVRQRRSDSRPYAQHAPTGGTGALKARAQHAEHHAARSHPLLCGPPNRSADGTCTHVRQRRSDSRPYAQHAPTGGTGALKRRPTQRRGAPVSATNAAAVHQLKLCFVVVLSVIPRTVAPRPRAAYNLALQFHARCLWVLRHAHYSERARAQHAEHHAARSHPLLCGPPNRSADGTCTHVRQRRSDSRPYAQHAPTGGTGALKRRPTQRRGAPVSATNAAAVHQLKLCFVVVLSVIPRTVAPRPRAAYNLALQFHARCLWVLRHAHYSERARAQHAEHHAARSHPLLCGPPNRSADGTCTHVRQRRSDSRPYAQHAPTGGTGALKAYL
ncbi:hypothetical protein CGC20_24035 [Leishmania donovani]|uniref:Uncharacterized protein n=1 Tax=Leishmania donovani TaxID=5661 RepID=A0A504XSW8_LEIDO|nr:hypothetical protein CGC20_24035 [Leishmania donovani]